MSSKEDLSFRSSSNIYELNDNTVQLPLKVETYSKSINHYRFKIEKLFQEARNILKETVEGPKSLIEQPIARSNQGSMAIKSQDASILGRNEGDQNANSYKYFFRDINKVLVFRNTDEIERCLKFIEDSSDISVMLPELSFDAKLNSAFFKHFGKFLRSEDFESELTKAALQHNFPSDCYSYTQLKNINLGHLKSSLIYMILVQLQDSEAGQTSKQDVEFKTCGRNGTAAVVNFLDKAFCSLFIAFSEVPNSEFELESKSFQGCLHLVMTTKPLDVCSINGLETLQVEDKKFTRAQESLANEVNINRTATYCTRQSHYAACSLFALSLKLDMNRDGLITVDDIEQFIKKYEILVPREVESRVNLDGRTAHSRCEREEVCLSESF